MSEQEWDQAGADPDAYPPGVDPYPPEDFGPTDQDLVGGHPFKPGRWGEICTYVHENGWACGFARGEHADQGRGEAIERP